jgi:hypothetical protein
VPVPLKKSEHAPVALMSQSSNVSAYMSVFVHALASAASLQRSLNLSANKYYYYYSVAILRCLVFPIGTTVERDTI